MTSRRSSRLALIAAFAAAVTLPGPAGAQSVELTRDGSVSIVAEGSSLGSLLARLGEKGRFHKLVVDPKVEARPVTITLDGATMRQAVVQILNAADVNYALTADDDGQAMRLIAGEVAFIAEQQRMLAQEEEKVSAPRLEPVLTANAAARDETETSKEAETVNMASDGGTAPPLDAAAEAFRLQQLQEALTTPAVRPPVGSVVELPFTGPDGRPLTTIMQAKPAVVPLPFPASPAPAGQTQPTAPQPIDPQTLQLIEMLSPKPVSR